MIETAYDAYLSYTTWLRGVKVIFPPAVPLAVPSVHGAITFGTACATCCATLCHSAQNRVIFRGNSSCATGTVGGTERGL